MYEGLVPLKTNNNKKIVPIVDKYKELKRLKSMKAAALEYVKYLFL